MSETRPRNIQIRYIMRATPGGMPVGCIEAFAGDQIPDGWLLLDGARIRTENFPDLYSVVGDNYCSPMLDRELPPGRWESVRRFFGLTPRRQYEQVPNPDYRPGYFRLPDLRSRFPEAP